MPISNFPRLRFTDITEEEVLDRTGAAVFLASASPLVAEATPAAQTSAVSILGVKQLDIFIDITTNPNSLLYVKVRFSGKESPDVAVPTDWGMVQVDNVAGATGISTAQEYMVEIDLNSVNGVVPVAGAPRRYLVRIDQVSGLWASALVWVGSGNGQGKVYFQRQGGSM